MDREAIKRVRDHIAGLKPEQFDMSLGIVENDCGCIKAWGERLLGRTAWKAALAGIGPKQRHELIMPAGWYARAPEYTRDRAVAVLDRLLETGEVDWTAPHALERLQAGRGR